MTPTTGGAVMAVETRFPSLAAMEQLIAMGVEEGMSAAIGQIPGILASDGRGSGLVGEGAERLR